MDNLNYILLGKILSGEASQEEQETFSRWVNENPENKQLFENYKYFYSNSNITEEYKEPIREYQSWKGKSFPWKRYVAIAASISVIILVAYFIGVNTAPVELTQDIPIENLLVTKANPKGQKSKIMLPDGSLVWLNSNSQIRYLDNFTDTLRMVSLNGEAYFEVVKDSDRPFIVNAGGIEAKVLGTRFNVKAFENDDQTIVSLLSGKLMVSNATSHELLSPGERIRTTTDSDQWEKTSENIEAMALWKDGILTFEKESFFEVIHQLERWYGVSIILQGQPSSKWQFTGFFENETLKNVLEVLSYGKNIDYELNGKNVKLIMQQ
ncbi:MAG: FecR family protein [Cyclobacteriaceae bacterium]